MQSKIVLFFFLCCSAISMFGANKEGSGVMTTKSFNVGVSEQIVLKTIKMKLRASNSSRYTCSIIVGNKNEVKITTDNNLINDLSLEHENETTTVSYDGWTSLRPTKLHIDIYTQKLSSINAVGVCHMRIDGDVKSDKLMIDLSTATKLISDSKINVSKCSINLSGASSLKMKHAYVNELIIDLGGATTLELSGKSGLLSADVAGGSTANLENFTVETIKGDVSGASTCRMYCTNSIQLEVSGASTAVVHGSCGKADFDVSGASSLKASNLKVKDVVIDCSGSANAEICASRTLRAESSGASSIKYFGDPSNVSKDSSGASSIRKSK